MGRTSSRAEYELKIDECLESEKERVGHHLNASSQEKLLKRVQEEMSLCYEKYHLENENQILPPSSSGDKGLSIPSVDIQPNVIYLEDGWNFVQMGFAKFKNLLEELPERQFSLEDPMLLYTTIYNMCSQPPPHDNSQQLYHRYKELVDEYMITTIRRERENEQIDQALLKNVLGIFVEIGVGTALEFLEKEKKGLGNYLHPSTGGKLVEVLLREAMIAREGSYIRITNTKVTTLDTLRVGPLLLLATKELHALSDSEKRLNSVLIQSTMS